MVRESHGVAVMMMMLIFVALRMGMRTWMCVGLMGFLLLLI